MRELRGGECAALRWPALLVLAAYRETKAALGLAVTADPGLPAALGHDFVRQDTGGAAVGGRHIAVSGGAPAGNSGLPVGSNPKCW